MAEYLIKDTTLTGIADQTRTLTGSTEQMKVAHIAANLETVNNEISGQTTLLNNLIEKINLLPEGGNGSSANIATGTVTTNSAGEIVFPKPSFAPQQMMVWNI